MVDNIARRVSRQVVMRYLFGFSMSAAAVLSTRPALATTDPPSFDPRALAMGGGGITYSLGSAGIVVNPALMQNTGRGDAMLSAYAVNAGSDAPVTAPDTRLRTDVLGPLGLVGVAYRLTPRLVLGFSAQPTSGIGADYSLPGNTKLEVTAALVEFDLAASFAITDKLTVGVAYRPSYVNEKITQPTPTPTEPTAATTVSLSHFNPLGASIGLHYQVSPSTALAFVYRTRLESDINGNAVTPGGTFDATSHFAAPDRLALGVDRRFMDDRLLVAAQAELVLFGALPDSTPLTLKTPAGEQTQTQVMSQRTEWAGKVGAEYWAVPDRFAVRGGLNFGPEQGNRDHASPFVNNYGFVVGPAIGLGVRFGRWRFDVAALYDVQHGIHVAKTDNGNPGYYGGSQFIGGGGAYYAF